MSLSTYADLVAAILSYLARDNDGAVIPTATFVLLSTTEFNRRLRTHFQETSHSVSTVGGTATYAIPDDCLNIREITVTGTVLRTLEYVSPNEIDAYRLNTETGCPHVYTIEGQSIRVAPVPDSSSYTINTKYYQKIGVLDADNLNWVYENYPDLYLYASLVEAMVFLGEDDMDPRAKQFINRREQIFAEIDEAERVFKTTSGPIRLKSAQYARRRW